MLHQWDWSESSLILDLFTRDSGRMVVVAKGAKRPYSQLRPVLMPFQQLVVGLGRLPERPPGDDGESGEIVTLRSAEYAGAGQVLPPARLMTGFYLNELLQKLLARSDPHPVLFDAYADALQALASESGEAPLRAFELVLLRLIGLLPELDRDTTTQRPVLPEASYRLDPRLGLVGAQPAPDPGGEGRPSVAGGLAEAALLPGALARALEQALAQATTDGACGRLRAACALATVALRQQMRPLLHYHLGTNALRTRDLMIAARRLTDAPVGSPS